MKIWLDDERPAPDGWIRAVSSKEMISLLQTNKVSEVSLDHDLGNDKEGTGYDVLLWIEKKVALENMLPPVIHIHTANASARQKMIAAVRAINRLSRK